MSNIVLHIPSRPTIDEENSDSLVSLDPTSLAAFFYLQLLEPARFELHSIPDVSSTPHGLTPYLVNPTSDTKGGEERKQKSVVSTFDSIILSLGAHLDDVLTEEENAKSVAWKTCILSRLGDLSCYTFYGNALNYNLFTHPYLVPRLPLLKRYYLPKRVRESFRRRLESEGMWEEGVHNKEREQDKLGLNKGIRETRDEKVIAGRKKIRQALANEKILEKARDSFSLFTRLLDSNEGKFIFGNSPSSADLLLAAHILVLLPSSSALPDNQLGKLLEKEFARLIKHAQEINALCSSRKILRPQSFTDQTLIE